MLLRTPLIVAAVAGLSSGIGGNAAAADCTTRTPDATSGKKYVQIGDVWAGTRIRFPVVQSGGKYFVGYFDADRWLTVAEYDPASGRICRTRTQSRFNGWDKHNVITLTFDRNRHIHVTGNMHNSSLVYATTATPNSVDGLKLQAMTGQEGTRITYPHFITSPSGRLLFMYRAGGSGNGAWWVNEYQDGQWTRLTKQPIFADSYENKPVSAYPVISEPTADGKFHFAVVWRRSPNVATNFRLSYASTRDFNHWEFYGKPPVSGSITPDNAQTIDDVGSNGGLTNMPVISIDNGRPLVAYVKKAGPSEDGIYLATPTAKGWKTQLSVKGPSPNALKGAGSLARDEATRIMDVDPASRTVKASFANHVTRAASFSGAPSSATRATPTGAKAPARLKLFKIPPGLLKPSVIVEPSDQGGAYIQYFAQDANRDRAPACDAKTPMACKPPASPLYLVLPD